MALKLCFKCKKEKDPSCFSIRKSTGKLHSYCKDCCKNSLTEWSKNNHGKVLEANKKYRLTNKNKIKQYNRNRLVERNKFLKEYLKNHPCIDCGETDPLVLDFDHIKDKKYDVSDAKRYSLKKLKLEIDKCEIRCANCHRRKTLREQGSTKLWD